ncbi:MAG: LPS export ABC transporter ATP-binding protein [Simkaniaceae bacterium]|nr:LPS export ABC transporter ATP-binding protein [Simkaniaceae bacterium]
MALLRAKKLAKTYGDRRIVNDLCFHIAPGEVVGLLGPNGAGKTTAFYITIGLIKPDEGQIFFNGNDITNAPIDERAKMGLGYLSQEPSIFRNLTVEDNIMCILETLDISKAERVERLAALLEELNLTSLAKQRASRLSGGERRRLEITRSLVTSPTLLLLDEPFANVDPITVSDVKKMILHLRSKNISVLITDHNAREIFSITDRNYLVTRGSLLAEGTSETLLANEEVRRYYLGDNFRL